MAPPAAEKLALACDGELFSIPLTVDAAVDDPLPAESVLLTKEAVCVAGIHCAPLCVDDAATMVVGLIPMRPESETPPLVLLSALFSSVLENFMAAWANVLSNELISAFRMPAMFFALVMLAVPLLIAAENDCPVTAPGLVV